MDRQNGLKDICLVEFVANYNHNRTKNYLKEIKNNKICSLQKNIKFGKLIMETIIVIFSFLSNRKSLKKIENKLRNEVMVKK